MKLTNKQLKQLIKEVIKEETGPMTKPRKEWDAADKSETERRGRRWDKTGRGPIRPGEKEAVFPRPKYDNPYTGQAEISDHANAIADKGEDYATQLRIIANFITQAVQATEVGEYAYAIDMYDQVLNRIRYAPDPTRGVAYIKAHTRANMKELRKVQKGGTLPSHDDR